MHYRKLNLLGQYMKTPPSEFTAATLSPIHVAKEQ